METPNAVPAPLQSIPIDQLKSNRWNRTVFDPVGLEELAANIKIEGIKERLIVRHLPDGTYEISSGHRRWLAAQKAGLKEVPCEVRTLTDEEVAQDNITLNLQRENLPPLELARMVEGYMKDFKKTQQQAAEKFGKTQTWISQITSFLEIPVEVRENIKGLIIGWDPLRALKASPKEIQLQVAKELKEGSLKPDQLEKRCNQLRFGGAKPSSSGKAHAAKTEGPVGPQPPDPLTSFWPDVQLDPGVVPPMSWHVSHGLDAEAQGPQSRLPGWKFWVMSSPLLPKTIL